MTKTEEIARFASLISAFPADSYIRPWLMSIREQVEADIRGDIFPTQTPADTRAMMAEEINRARDQAAGMIDTATIRAAAIVKTAETEAANIRARMESAKNEALRAVAQFESRLNSI